MMRGTIRLRLGVHRLHVEPGFWIAGVVLGLLYGWPFGALLAGAVALLTVVHEFGHAFAARCFGAKPVMVLGAASGRTTLATPVAFSRAARTAITLAGPFAQIVIGSVALVTVGASPWSYPSATSNDLRSALWWAGPVIGLANLLPIVPLDGGMVLTSWLDGVHPRRGLTIARVIGVALLVAGCAVAFIAERPQLSIGFALAVAIAIGHALVESRSRTTGEPLPGPSFDSALELLERDELEQAAALASEQFASAGDPHLAVIVAHCAARSGDVARAVEWLRASAVAGAPRAALNALDTDADFVAVRMSPAALALRAELRAGCGKKVF